MATKPMTNCCACGAPCKDWGKYGSSARERYFNICEACDGSTDGNGYETLEDAMSYASPKLGVKVGDRVKIWRHRTDLLCDNGAPANKEAFAPATATVVGFSGPAVLTMLDIDFGSLSLSRTPAGLNVAQQYQGETEGKSFWGLIHKDAFEVSPKYSPEKTFGLKIGDRVEVFRNEDGDLCQDDQERDEEYETETATVVAFTKEGKPVVLLDDAENNDGNGNHGEDYEIDEEYIEESEYGPLWELDSKSCFGPETDKRLCRRLGQPSIRLGLKIGDKIEMYRDEDGDLINEDYTADKESERIPAVVAGFDSEDRPLVAFDSSINDGLEDSMEDLGIEERVKGEFKDKSFWPLFDRADFVVVEKPQLDSFGLKIGDRVEIKVNKDGECFDETSLAKDAVGSEVATIVGFFDGNPLAMLDSKDFQNTNQEYLDFEIDPKYAREAQKRNAAIHRLTANSVFTLGETDKTLGLKVGDKVYLRKDSDGKVIDMFEEPDLNQEALPAKVVAFSAGRPVVAYDSDDHYCRHSPNDFGLDVDDYDEKFFQFIYSEKAFERTSLGVRIGDVIAIDRKTEKYLADGSVGDKSLTPVRATVVAFSTHGYPVAVFDKKAAGVNSGHSKGGTQYNIDPRYLEEVKDKDCWELSSANAFKKVGFLFGTKVPSPKTEETEAEEGQSEASAPDEEVEEKAETETEKAEAKEEKPVAETPAEPAKTGVTYVLEGNYGLKVGDEIEIFRRSPGGLVDLGYDPDITLSPIKATICGFDTNGKPMAMLDPSLGYGHSYGTQFSWITPEYREKSKGKSFYWINDEEFFRKSKTVLGVKVGDVIEVYQNNNGSLCSITASDAAVPKTVLATVVGVGEGQILVNFETKENIGWPISDYQGRLKEVDLVYKKMVMEKGTRCWYINIADAFKKVHPDAPPPLEEKPKPVEVKKEEKPKYIPTTKVGDKVDLFVADDGHYCYHSQSKRDETRSSVRATVIGIRTNTSAPGYLLSLPLDSRGHSWHNDCGAGFIDPAYVEQAKGGRTWFVTGLESEANCFRPSTGTAPIETKPKFVPEATAAVAATAAAVAIHRTPFGAMIKEDASSALYRVAATQINAAAKAGIVRMLTQQGKNSQMVESIKGLMETEAGDALVSAILGLLFTYAPKLSEHQKAQRLATEFRVQSLSVIGNSMIEMALEQLLPVISESLSGIPKAESTVGASVCAEESIETVSESEETETPKTMEN